MAASEHGKLKALLAALPDIPFVLDEDGRYVDVITAHTELLLKPEFDLKGKLLHELFPAHEADRFVSAVHRTLATGKPQLCEYRIQTPDGMKWFEGRTSVLLPHGSGKSLVVWLARDVTERKKLEASVLRAQKMEALSLVAAGIAHDFNNLMTAILGNISLAQMLTETETPAAKALESAESAIASARRISDQLLTFSHGRSLDKSAVDLRELVSRATELALAGSAVSRAQHLPDEPLLVECDPGQIEQAIHNVVLNARQAVEESGHVTVSLTRQSSIILPGSAVTAEHFASIAITDNGPGIDNALQARIFDPFFTTKSDGTGVGLSNCYSIITAHGGTVLIDSTPGAGSTFTLLIPAHVLRTEDRRPESAAPANRRARTQRLLFMDESPRIRETTKNMLEILGYEADIAASGEDALLLFTQAERDGHEYSVVILDLTVSGGAGAVETVRQLQRIDPDTRAIVATGHGDSPVLQNPGEYGFVGALAKPFDLHTLNAAIERALAQ